MPSILNATTSSGLVTSADNSGSLQLATNNGTTAVTIDTSQNVGIGTTTPTFTSGGGLQVKNSGFTSVRVSSGSSTGVDFAQATDGLAYMYNRDNNGLAFGANNTEQARITAAGLMQFNSGYGSVATAYGCRAWVRFNGIGTPAIVASGNISSITDDGVGLYTLNFTNAMPDANYAGACNTSFAAGNNGAIDSVGQIYEPATGSAKVVFGLTNGSKRDHGYNLVLIVR